MSNLPSGPFLCMFMGLFVPALSAAQSPSQHACSTLADPNERLACYDRAFPPVAGAGTSVADVEARRRQAIEESGFSKHQLMGRTEGAEPDRIEGVVKTVAERSSGERVVTFENGQVWLLTEVTGRLSRLNPGDKVAVREAALGSYMLVTPTRVALRAKRLR